MADGDRIPKVLVVDDEPNIRELVEVALKFLSSSWVCFPTPLCDNLLPTPVDLVH